jgi:hypothetical protein
MNFRNNLGDSYRKGDFDGKQNKKGSRAYQRFFEGYEEITIPDKNGRGYQIKRIYRGEYYRQDISDSKWIGLKILYFFLFVGSFCFFAKAALLNLPVNSVWYVTMSQAADVAVYFWSFTALCSYIVSERNMTISKYKRACVPIRYALKSSFIVLLVTFFLNILFLVLDRDRQTGGEVINMIQYLISAFLIFVMYELESRIAYVTLER